MPRQSNCYREARRVYQHRLAEWLENPDPDRVPYFLERPSFGAPVDHYLVGTLDRAGDVVRVESFKPLHPVRRARWWQLPTTFRGEWRDGDADSAALIDGPPPAQPAWLKWTVRAMRFFWG